jgi:hypothetical protein
MWDAGIAEENYSHVGDFPSRAGYDILFAILFRPIFRVADISVLSFAPLALGGKPV